MLVLLLTGCFHPSYDRTACGPAGACPSGFTCVADVCVVAGAPADGAVDIALDATPATDARPPGATGCKALPQFKTGARPELQNNCAICHDGSSASSNPTAVASMDLTNVAASSDAQILVACDQVLSHLDVQAPDKSAFYIVADAASSQNHPFKFPNTTSGETFASFKAAMDVWVNAEVLAQ